MLGGGGVDPRGTQRTSDRARRGLTGGRSGLGAGTACRPRRGDLLPGAEAYEALSIERSGAVRQVLGAIKRELDAKAIDPMEAARRIIDAVAFYGLTKVDLPEPRQPITEEDIGVVCWMAVLPGGP